MPLTRWVQQGRRFGYMSRCSQWWVGDWVRFGEAAYGTRYHQAAKITGYDVQSLMNMVYIASRCEISRRREKLSWSHHAELASYSLQEQEKWLDECERANLSVHDLRTELRQARRVRMRNTASEGTVGAEAEQVRVTCPECGCRFEVLGPHDG